MGGTHDEFFVEVDDDIQREGGTGGYYVLWWTLREHGWDDWLEDWPSLLAYWREAQGKGDFQAVEWMHEPTSARVPGRHRHDG